MTMQKQIESVLANLQNFFPQETQIERDDMLLSNIQKIGLPLLPRHTVTMKPLNNLDLIFLLFLYFNFGKGSK